MGGVESIEPGVLDRVSGIQYSRTETVDLTHNPKAKAPERYQRLGLSCFHPLK